MLLVVGGIGGLGAAVGLGAASVLAALTGLFCFMAAAGGALRPDLRVLAGVAPAMVVGVAVPRLVAEASEWAGIALVALIVFVAALLPALGRRYVQVGLGLGMASLFGYGYQLTGVASPVQIVGAPVLAVVVVVALRALIGARDPSGPTRAVLAEALSAEPPPDPAESLRAWHGDRPVRWTAQVLAGAIEFRAVLGVLADRCRMLPADRAQALESTLDSAREEAARLAGTVRSQVPDDPAEVAREALSPGFPGATVDLVDRMWSALESVRSAAFRRDTTRVRVSAEPWREVLRVTSGGTLSWRSTQLRHAVRCAVGVLVALVVASLRPGDPLTVPFLMTTFAIMQPEWRDTLAKAVQRVVGVLAGAVVLAAVIRFLPTSALVPVAVLALLVGFWFMRSRPVVFNGCIVLMSVGLNATTRQLDPADVLVEYLVLIGLAVVIGLLFGFAAVPGVRRPGSRELVDRACSSVRALLLHVADVMRGRERDHREMARLFRTAVRDQQALVAAKPRNDAAAEALDTAAESLTGLMRQSVALLLAPRNAGTAAAVERTAELLVTPQEGEPAALPDADDETRLVVAAATSDVLRLRQVADVVRDGQPVP
ncbi:hypothetical protein GCM10025787_35460 [Saccharopolyspora rosea]|uniref:FUSC family protein n=1 Tax=Saccharopolyspora rosea TaxID=524884 RepID=A0ABW3G1B9_9PSEU